MKLLRLYDHNRMIRMRLLAKVDARMICLVPGILVPSTFVTLTMPCGGAGQILRALNRDREAVETERRVLELLQTDKRACMDGSCLCLSVLVLPRVSDKRLVCAPGKSAEMKSDVLRSKGLALFGEKVCCTLQCRPSAYADTIHGRNTALHSRS